MVNVKPSIGELFESNLVEGGRKIRLEIVVRKPQGSGPFPVVIAYFAESDRSFRVIVTDAGMLHG